VVDAWRVVESQSILSTRKLVDNAWEYEVLENEIEKNKPDLQYQGYHYLLTTPFRYPPLKYGSRFGKSIEPSLWYGSLNFSTTLTESAYYSFVFISGSAMKEFNTPIYKTAFQVKIATADGLDLTVKPFLEYKSHISSKSDWSKSQLLGMRMRENSIQAFSYFSAREHNSDSINIGAFSFRVFAQKKPKKEVQLEQFMNRNLVEFFDKNTSEHFTFMKDDFLVNGEFPYPPG
jgi:hypothetical protein